MPRPPNLDPLRALIQSIGQQIGTELAAAVDAGASAVIAKSSALKAAAPRPGRRGRPALSAAEAPCAVPGCSRKRAAKRLCQTHYAKAHRIKLNLDKLSASDLETLGADGRATRWKK